jgi:hypothetical protein
MPRPDFLFTITGLSAFITEHVRETVQNVWQDEHTQEAISEAIATHPVSQQTSLALSIRAFLLNPRITRLDIRDRDQTLRPHFNVYANGGALDSDAIWTFLRDYLASRAYTTPMQTRSETKRAPYHCGLCHSIDHPRGLCPFPALNGWNGPQRNPTAGTRRRGEGNQIRNPGPRARRVY